MLEHIPTWLGALLRDRRAGHAKLVSADPAVGRDTPQLGLDSPAFAHGARLPVRFTADGEGMSPPLTWSHVPPDAVRLALIVEDPDAPTPSPLVHALLWDIPPGDRALPEGALGGEGAIGRIGRNSFLRQGGLPPDPPSGHGEHDYVFQLMALGPGPDLSDPPGRGEFTDAIQGRVLAAGVLIGTYSR